MSFATERQESSDPTESDYRAFLLRCWREAGVGPDGQATWRFCVVKPGDGQTQCAFASLETLMAYLRQELEAA
jgi:hypothetical protein